MHPDFTTVRDERVVFKWRLDKHAEFTQFNMPYPEEVLHVGIQEGHICVWAEHMEGATPMPVTFRIVGTGVPFDKERWQHIGTVQMNNYAGVEFVWHVYMMIEH